MPSNNLPLPSFFDLHNHLVPGVDDGAHSVQEALETLDLLGQEGVRGLVTTPHLLVPQLTTDAAIDRELALQRRAWEELADSLDRRDDLPAVALGQEIWAPDAAALHRVVRRPGVGLGASDVLLIEFGFELQGTHEDVLRAARAAGRRVVIAHPERYQYLTGIVPLEQMTRWRELGALLQVNAGSLSGYYEGSNPGSERLAWGMVEAGLLDIVSTDNHASRRRGALPREAWDALIARGERELAERAMAVVPGEIVTAALSSPGGAG
jgi:protein-tyrosine phosphatase